MTGRKAPWNSSLACSYRTLLGKIPDRVQGLVIVEKRPELVSEAGENGESLRDSLRICIMSFDLRSSKCEGNLVAFFAIHVHGYPWLLFFPWLRDNRYGGSRCSRAGSSPFPVPIRLALSTVVLLSQLQPIWYDDRSDQFLQGNIPVISNLSQLGVGGISKRLHELRQPGYHL